MMNQSYPGHWKGHWIWDSGEAYPFHYFLMVRRSFALHEPAIDAKIRITCSGRYMLYVNGVYIGRGPARSDPRWKSYDVHDLTDMLCDGQNTIAVLTYHYGCQNNYTRDERAGFWAQVELRDISGNERKIGTDAQWKVCRAKGWDQDVDLINSCLGVTEVYDAQADPPDWMMQHFKDEFWEDATVLQFPPWSYLEARRTPTMLERERFPESIAVIGEIREHSHAINGLPPSLSVQQVPERLASELYIPSELSRVENQQMALAADGRAMTVLSYPYAAGQRGEGRSQCHQPKL